MTSTSQSATDGTDTGCTSKTVSGGEFFVVDRRGFAAACALGLNPVVAYVTITRGAGSRPMSRWSVDAIERHTGMSRPKAKLAVEILVKAGLLTREGAATRPVYRIVPGHEAGLSANEREVVKVLGHGPAKLPKRLQGTALGMWSRGFLNSEWSGRFSIKDPDRFSDKPQQIWLPNALIDGAANETPPLALLRQMQDARWINLFVRLYDNHDLPEDGGVSRALLWQEHKLTKVGQRGALTIWGFGPAEFTVTAPGSSPLRQIFLTGKNDKDGEDPGSQDFWDAIQALRACGLITFIPHLFESNGPEAEMLHAYPIDADGCEQWELDVATAAHAAATSCLTSAQVEWAVSEKGLNLLPVRSHMTKLTIIGVARLRYRPQTRKTAAWFAKRKEGCQAWQAAYEEILREVGGRGAAVA